MQVSYETLHMLATFGDEEAKKIIRAWARNTQKVFESTQAYYAPNVGFFLGEKDNILPKKPSGSFSFPKSESIIIEDNDGETDGEE